MLEGQNIVVDHLVKIIQAIQIGKMTGSLVATRGEGSSYEWGTMVFLNGQVIQGRVGQREGHTAFNWLSTWGRCQYTFVHSITSNLGQHAKGQLSDRETPLQSKIPPMKLMSARKTQKLSPDLAESAMRKTRKLSPDLAESFMRKTQNLSPDLAESATRKTQKLSPDLAESATNILPRQKLNHFMQAVSKASLEKAGPVNEAIPHRSKPLDYGLQVLSEKSLSRVHRHVFLLTDGARRVGDLMRLLQLSENQTLALLYDLQDMGIISLPSSVLA